MWLCRVVITACAHMASTTRSSLSVTVDTLRHAHHCITLESREHRVSYLSHNFYSLTEIFMWYRQLYVKVKDVNLCVRSKSAHFFCDL